MKLKEEFVDKLIWIGFENRFIIGKFIDKRLYKWMNSDLFEIEKNEINNDKNKRNGK